METFFALVLGLVVLWIAFKLIVKFFWVALVLVIVVVLANIGEDAPEKTTSPPVQTTQAGASEEASTESNENDPPSNREDAQQSSEQQAYGTPASDNTRERAHTPSYSATSRTPVRDPACMAYRHLLPPGTEVVSARQDGSRFKDPTEFEWLLWQRNIDPLHVRDTGVVCAYNNGKFVIHEYEHLGQRSAVRYERIGPP